ncbi:hypothetical protein N5O88_09405 [Pseudomonas sp. GD03721]|nr:MULTISPECIES: hypothetical protein [unclassified Pseudomonas]MDH1440520.1 hypothetical protein [Pseudomonas sp. GD03722]WGG03394.1 hypothetical protein N5O88_09405 [Pseudomonas sp. GD03721]WGG07562.1 hypothetical protein N5O87_09415 [Pseudomonas sp. GD03919]
MTGKQSSPKTSKQPRVKKTGGGTAVGGGINFQATVTAIVGVHILRGTSLNWLEGVCSDKPSAVWAESEGPGDDLRIELGSSSRIEVQAKKGLARGPNLWAALHSIAIAIHTGQLSYGVLVVASDSSKTIREDLATDIERLGQGRTDLLTNIGADWAQRLRDAKIPAKTVCRCIRIRVIHALSAEGTSINAAKELLRHVCARDEDVDAAWNCLFRHAVLLIEKRGRWTLQDLIRLLRNSNIAIREGDFPASVFDRYSKWVIDTTGHFFITGIRRKIPLAHLLPMRMEAMEFTPPALENATSALERYHKSTERNLFGEEFASIWTARFKTRVVVVAGPGLGKSTMVKELAHQYAQDGYLVLRVALKPIAAAMMQGAAFSELLLNHALDGSQLSPNQIESMARLDWVILADGLDECGSAHHQVAEQISKFALGHPAARIVVTTRPIGYDTVALSDWNHYRLLPPRTEEGAGNLEKLVCGALIDDPANPSAPDLSQYQLGQIQPANAISISPQLLGMSASLICHRRALPSTRLELYAQLISLFEKLPADSPPEQADFYEIVLNIIGWILIISPLIVFEMLIDRTATTLAPMMDVAPLPLKKEIRLAVAHWERVGLVEKVFHQGTVLLSFIHKTFCEFVASRFLARYPKGLIEDVVDDPDKQEVVKFAVGQGLGDELIALYLNRHATGRSQQLQSALALLGNKEIAVSTRWTEELIRRSFEAVEDGASDKFSIGIAISDLGAKASHLVESLAASKLEAANPAVKLIAWATIIRCNSHYFDAVTLYATLAEMLPQIEPFSLRDVLDKKDRGDRDLLQLIALAALKAQPNESARSFAEQELQDDRLLTISFRFQVNNILKSKGTTELPSMLQEGERVASPVVLTRVGPGLKEASLYALRSITKAFINEDTQISIEPSHYCDLHQLAGLMHAAGYGKMPASDTYSWLQIHDEPAVQSTMKAVAQLLPLDLHRLAGEAKEVIHRLDLNLFDSVFTLLPAVDIDPPAWERAAEVQINREEVMRALLHPSSWINLLATNLWVHLEMSQDELEWLLRSAQGYSLQCVIALIQYHHSEETTKMLLQRLSIDTSGDLSNIFDVLRKLEPHPSTELMSTTLACLHSSDEKTVESATELLSAWVDGGIVIDKESVARAVEHWGGRDSLRRCSLVLTPIGSLIGLLDRINETQR